MTPDRRPWVLDESALALHSGRGHRWRGDPEEGGEVQAHPRKQSRMELLTGGDASSAQVAFGGGVVFLNCEGVGIDDPIPCDTVVVVNAEFVHRSRAGALEVTSTTKSGEPCIFRSVGFNRCSRSIERKDRSGI
jgi:hypothetical protein